jgi:acyl-CoA thioester hydrolase
VTAFSHVDRVRFGDLDAMRHLNNVALLRFFESARVAYFAELIDGYRPEERGEFGLIMAECHVHYRSPAFYDDELATTIRPSDVARSAFRTNFAVHATADGRLVAEGYGVLVGYDYAVQHARPLSDELKAALAADGAQAASAP